MKKFLICLLVFISACISKEETSEDCPSLKLSNEEKIDKKLFLDFYYGMNEKEFENMVDSLVSQGVLGKDSLIKFRIDFPIVSSKDELIEPNSNFYFSLTPVFNDCKLYEVSLSHLYIQSPSVMDTEYARYPDKGDAKRIEKNYTEKYGKPQVEIENVSLDIIETKSWMLQNNRIKINNIYTPKEYYSYTGKKVKSNVLTGFYIEYINVIEENKIKSSKDSTETSKLHEQNNKASNSLKHL